MTGAMNERQRGGFSLVELLVVIGVIAILIGMLLPVLQAARAAASTTRCASNMRQVMIAMTNYAQDYHGKFPGNRGGDHQLWYNADVLGKYVKGGEKLPDNTMGRGVFVCPADYDDARRSYSMNVWASAFVSDYVEAAQHTTPPDGKLFTYGTKEGQGLIVLAEALWEDPAQNDAHVNAAPAVCGAFGAPGARFGGGAGVGYSSSLYGYVSSQLDYSRHRPANQRALGRATPVGVLNLGFADGHVQRFRSDELYDEATGKSRYAALWSPIDREIE